MKRSFLVFMGSPWHYLGGGKINGREGKVKSSYEKRRDKEL